MATLQQDFIRAKAIELAIVRLQLGLATSTDLAAQLLANFDQAAADVFTAATAGMSTTQQSAPMQQQTGLSPTGISLLVTGNHNLSLPLITGKRPLVKFGGFSLTSRSATTVTGTLTFSVGTNSSTFDNIIPATNVAAAAFNNTTFSLPYFMPFALPNFIGMPDMGTQVVLRISAALGGVATLQGRFGLDVLYA